MQSRSTAWILSVAVCAGLFATAQPGFADDDKGPVTGVPDESIAKGWNDATRAAFARRGVTYGINYTGEVYDVASGGVSRGTTYNGLVEGYTDLDLEKIMGWKGGTIHANVYYLHGVGPTSNTGSIFAVSNLEGLETVRLDELWFEQALFDDKLKIKLGSIAADTEFFISDTAASFLNGTFGWAGIVAADMVQGGPAYPLASMGARVEFAPTDKLTILGAVFNGSPANPLADDAQADNRHGTDFRFGDGALGILEGQFKYDVSLPGVVKVGAWKQFNNDGIYSDFVTGAPVNGSYGIYGIIDQQIWKKGDDQSINVFGRVSGSPDKQDLIDTYFDTGIQFTGFVPGRTKEAFGAAFGYGHISDRFQEAQATPGNANESPVIAHYESVLEANYIAHICDGITLTPDFQYFWNPGGRVADDNGNVIDHAAVFGARTKISY